jgi:hypothetical protein
VKEREQEVPREKKIASQLVCLGARDLPKQGCRAAN